MFFVLEANGTKTSGVAMASGLGSAPTVGKMPYCYAHHADSCPHSDEDGPGGSRGSCSEAVGRSGSPPWR